MQPRYRNHLYPTETFMEAMEKLYEDELISRAIVVCLNDTEAVDCANELNRRCYSAKAVVPSEWETDYPVSLWKALYQFKRQPNQILVLSLTLFQQLDKVTFEQHLMRSQWNVLVSVDVPSYQMDAVFERVSDAHRRGFWNPPDDVASDFHLMWYQN